MEIDNEPVPSPPSTCQRETTIVPVDIVFLVDPIAPIDVPRDIAVGHKRNSWARQTLQEAEEHASPQGTFPREQETKEIFELFFSHEPSEPCHGEASGQKVWQDEMEKRYQSIMKNDVWDIVPRLEGKFVVNSKWIYKIKNAVDGRVKKYKEIFVARGFS
jgi:hypothetical protein